MRKSLLVRKHSLSALQRKDKKPFEEDQSAEKKRVSKMRNHFTNEWSLKSEGEAIAITTAREVLAAHRSRWHSIGSAVAALGGSVASSLIAFVCTTPANASLSNT